MDNQRLSQLFSRMPDREAFSQIYEILKQPVYTICLRILRNRETAEDVCQDVFVKLYTAPPDPSLRNLSAWVFRMTRNLAIDTLRNQQVRNSTPPEEEISVFPDWDTRLDLEAAISSLTLPEREVLTLHINAGLTFSQIAVITGSSLPSVYRTYRRSLKRLRNILIGGTL